MRLLVAVLLLCSWAAAQEVGKLCVSCHIEHVDDLKSHKHAAKNISCEVCHGESKPHRNAVGATAPDRVAGPDEAPALCGTCHTSQLKAYTPSAHGKLVLSQSKTRAAQCTTCHGAHSPRNAVAMKRQCDRCHAELPAACKQPVTVAAGKLACAACHDPHTLAKRQ